MLDNVCNTLPPQKNKNQILFNKKKHTHTYMFVKAMQGNFSTNYQNLIDMLACVSAPWGFRTWIFPRGTCGCVCVCSLRVWIRTCVFLLFVRHTCVFRSDSLLLLLLLVLVVVLSPGGSECWWCVSHLAVASTVLLTAGRPNERRCCCQSKRAATKSIRLHIM